MRTYGDIPEKDRELLKELQMLEAWFHTYGLNLKVLSIAKGMVCIAHDYYMMDFEEEGDRILNIAEAHCPGYFKAAIHSHIKSDKDFRNLVRKIEDCPLAYDYMSKLGYEKQI